MKSWDPGVFARFAERAAVESSAVALSGVLEELGKLGFTQGGSSPGTLAVSTGEMNLRLTPPEDLSDESLHFVRHLLSGIARRMTIEAKFAQAEERTTMLSQASFEGILVHKNGLVIAVNDSLSELLGLPTHELLGEDTIARCVADHDIPTVMEKMRSGYEGSYVIDGVRGDGTGFRAELQSKQGKLGDEPIRVVAVRDVTERERMLNLLRDSEAQLRDLVDTVFDVTILSQDGRAIDVSETAKGVTGYRREEILGRHVWEFVAPETRVKTEEFVSNERVGAYESVLIAKNGDRIPIEVVATNTTLGGEPVRLAGLRDLRKAKAQERQRDQLRKQMEQAQRLDSLGALAGGVAHDFNNLLVGILGTAELIKDDLTDPYQIELAQTLLDASHRAKELTGRLLAYSGKTNLVKPEPIDLAALFQHLEKLTCVSRPRGISFSLDFEERCVVEGEQAAIMQVMLNLVTNAIEAIGSEEGSIVVRGRHVKRPDVRWDQALGEAVGPGNYIQVEVTDTGTGMDSETALRAFEPFFTTKTRGHGLGLAASLGILKAHGGAVHVKSEPSLGTTFAVLLPSADTEPRAETAEMIAESRPRLILIVDDEAIVRQHVVRVLKRRGYELLVADGPNACLAHVEKHQPDLILMDLTMPDGSGAETASLLRSRGVATPIILTSGYVPSSGQDAFSPELFQGFLRKPYSISELASAIECALSSGGAGGIV